MTDHEADPTRRFAQPVDDQTENKLNNAPDTDPTRTAPATADETATGWDPNELSPNPVRFVLICLLFAFISVWIVINNYHLFSQTADSGIAAAWTAGAHYVIYVSPDLADNVEVGDEAVSIDGQPLGTRYSFRQIVRKFKIGETHSLQLKRNGVAYDVDVQAEPLPPEYTLNNLSNGVTIPFGFFTVGLLLFLFKPNNRLTVLAAISFVLTAASTSPIYFISYAEGALPIVLIWQIGYFLSLLSGVVLLHFMLYFPKPSRLVRRFPRLPVIIYLPFLLYVLPTEIAQQVSWNGLTPFDVFYEQKLLFLGDFFYSPYLLADILVLFANYREADEPGRRRLRILMLAVPLTIFPFIFVDLLLPPVEWLLGFQLFRSAGLRDFVGNMFIVAVPPIFAYAVVKHRVIPISFIVRRGLQYLFAKNALRLLIILPAFAIAWNIISNPDRTLGDLILRNSTSFYVFLLAVAAIALTSRYRLNDWIDRRFFREQYDQERLLRELIDNVKESDSMIKLSRLVSSHIQTAMHPSSIHFFYEDQINSDFSLGFSTGENTGNMKLGAGSPVLRFMQQQRGSVDFPSIETAELVDPDANWLVRIGTKLLVPMHGTEGRLAGFFSLGEKRSELPYTERDRELLGTLANQIAIVHENLSLKDRVRRDQKIRTEVLSRLDEGNVNLLKVCPQCGRCFDRAADRCSDDSAELTFTLPVERTIEKRYRLEKLIGKGGMGGVYEATDLRIDRIVAVKILDGSLFGDRSAQRRFEREAQAAGKLNHRNIVTVFDYGVLPTEGAFLVMERVYGSTLTDVLRKKGKLPISTVTDWFSQVLDGIEAAHNTGIVHRDLKPDNIFVTQQADGTVRLCILDFGLARFSETEMVNSVTVPGMIMGTFGYMSPEQLEGKGVDERSDLFSATAVLYECLYGQRPFAGTTFLEIVQSMSERTEFDLPCPFKEFFDRGLAQDPAKRTATAAEMKRGLLNLYQK